jgi:hypothetical protein
MNNSTLHKVRINNHTVINCKTFDESEKIAADILSLRCEFIDYGFDINSMTVEIVSDGGVISNKISSPVTEEEKNILLGFYLTASEDIDAYSSLVKKGLVRKSKGKIKFTEAGMSYSLFLLSGTNN